MTYICTYCSRLTPDGNLFCTQKDCPKYTHPIFGSGQWVGDLQVVRWIYSTNLAHFYEATRQSQTFLLKVAHHYDQYEMNSLMQPHHFLTAEVNLWTQVAEERRRNKRNFDVDDPNHPLNILPVIQPSFAVSSTSYYGLTQIHGRSYYYSVFEWIDGIFLTEYLAQTPKPFVSYVGQMMRALVDALSYLYKISSNYAHLNLSPDSIFIRASDDVMLRPVLLDLGFVRPQNQPTKDEVFYAVVKYYADPSYTHPDLWRGVDIAYPRYADLYSLGMLTYRLVTGKPLVDETFISRDELREKINQQLQATLASLDNMTSEKQLNQVIKIGLEALQKSTVHIEHMRGILQQFAPLDPIPKEKTLLEITWKWGLLTAIIALSLTLLAVVVSQIV